MVTPRLVLLLFLVAQAWDGVFTYTAVSVYGFAAEGNALLATWMAIAGPAPTLLAAKAGAALGGVLLYVQGVHRVLGGLTLFYGAVSIAPWVVIFHTHP